MRQRVDFVPLMRWSSSTCQDLATFGNTEMMTVTALAHACASHTPQVGGGGTRGGEGPGAQRGREAERRGSPASVSRGAVGSSHWNGNSRIESLADTISPAQVTTHHDELAPHRELLLLHALPASLEMPH